MQGQLIHGGSDILLNAADLLVISPTHKRTEGRAPVWGSEFTSKDAALQGEPAEAATTLNAKLWVLPGCVVTDGNWWHLTAISPNHLSTRKLKADEKRAVSRVE